MATYNLTLLNNAVNGGSGNAVTWYQDANATIPINNPSNHITAATTVYAVVSSANCDSQPVPITLNATPAPTAINIQPLLGCAPTGGQAVFNLTLQNNIINGNSGNPVSWFFDMNGNTPINNPTSFPTGTSTTVYAVVGTPPCTSTPLAVALNVTSAPVANNIPPLVGCTPAGGQAVFNLALQNNIINGNSGNPVSWFVDMNTTAVSYTHLTLPTKA